jgi:hypothetical protein
MYEYKCGPYEYYHNENNEPMFRGIKVRNLAEMFSKEENYRDYTVEQFKEWLKRTCPEEDWIYINEWGRLDGFDCIALYNNQIYDYLFQLGLDPEYKYIECIHNIKIYEEKILKVDFENKKGFIERMLNRYKELLEVCKKYMSDEDIKKALIVKDIIDSSDV